MILHWCHCLGGERERFSNLFSVDWKTSKDDVSWTASSHPVSMATTAVTHGQIRILELFYMRFFPLLNGQVSRLGIRNGELAATGWSVLPLETGHWKDCLDGIIPNLAFSDKTPSSSFVCFTTFKYFHNSHEEWSQLRSIKLFQPALHMWFGTEHSFMTSWSYSRQSPNWRLLCNKKDPPVPLIIRSVHKHRDALGSGIYSPLSQQALLQDFQADAIAQYSPMDWWGYTQRSGSVAEW